MTTITADARTRPVAPSHWLKRYYSLRAIVSVVWVALAFTLGAMHPPIGIALLIAYPLWDCIANYLDAGNSGGLRANPTQALNTAVSAVVTVAVIVTAPQNFHVAIGVIGIWAALAGIFQLGTGVRRWKRASAQWPQILSGAQSAIAGVHFVIRAADPTATLSVATVAPYAAFGALYFGISAIVLAVKRG